MNVKGLHLWEVDLSHVHETLWITTRTRDLRQATAKAEAVIKKSEKYRECVIKAITNRGTIDA